MKHRAFSLIEIIIAVAIVALISAAAVLGFGQQRATSRDARRISDASTISSAIENYDSVNSDTIGIFDSGGQLITTASAAPLVTGGFLNSVPTDPKPTTGVWGQCQGYYMNTPVDKTNHASLISFTTELAPNTTSLTANSGDTLVDTLGYAWGTHTLNRTVIETTTLGCKDNTRYLAYILGHKLDANKQ